MVRVERDVGAAGFQNRKQAGDQFDRTLRADAHRRFVRDAQGGEPPGERGGAAVQLGIRHARIAAHDGHGVRRARGLLLEQTVNRRVARVVRAGTAH